jgi:hypothetical protein
MVPSDLVTDHRPANVLVLFGGRGKGSALMGDFGKGLKSLRRA